MTFPATLQELSPSAARLMLAAERFLREETKADLERADLVVASSGGADSTALFLFLRLMASRWKARLHLAYFDHGLRPESRAEGERVGQMAEQCKVPFFRGAAPIAEMSLRRGAGIEETARRERYRFLETTRKLAGADLICVAHHADDLAEDLLMRLLRGTAWPGLAGMPAFDPERRLLRPFLMTPKQSLIDLLRECGLSWSEDISNQNPAFLRNRVRKEMVPLFMRENPSFPDAVRALWRIGRDDAEFFELMLAHALAEVRTTHDALRVDRALVAGLPRALRLRLFKRLLDRLGPDQAEAASLFALDKAVTNAEEPRLFQFAGNKNVRLSAKTLLFTVSTPG